MNYFGYNLVICVLSYALIDTGAQGCDLRVEDACFTFFDNFRSWQGSDEACARKGGRLASIMSLDEQTAIYREMHIRGWQSAWVGGRELRTDWRWLRDNSYLTYQGCYRDDPSDRDLPITTDLPSSQVTPDACVSRCRTAGKAYAGIQTNYLFQGGHEIRCRCGDTYGKHGQTTGCTHICVADRGRYCGGYFRQAIYRVDASNVSLWYRDQPNNFSPYQECLSLSDGNEYKWGDEMCWRKFYFICQYGFDEHNCKIRNHIYAAGTCYSLVEEKKSWFHARSECRRRSATLLKMDSYELYLAVKEGVRRGPRGRWWIGGTNRRWAWRSGRDILYTGWAETSPDSPLEECLLIKWKSGRIFHWDDEACVKSNYYICQTEELEGEKPKRKVDELPFTEIPQRTQRITTNKPPQEPWTRQRSHMEGRRNNWATEKPRRNTLRVKPTQVSKKEKPIEPSGTLPPEVIKQTCTPGAFQCQKAGNCIFASWVCDSELDCADGSDELGCNSLDPSSGPTCPTDWFQCTTNRRCISGSWRCDGESDCSDGSDERECPSRSPLLCRETEFECDNGFCIQESWKCDGELDCPDDSDERGCTTPGPFTTRRPTTTLRRTTQAEPAEPTCTPVRCRQECRWGFATRADGCPTCSCKSGPPTTRREFVRVNPTRSSSTTPAPTTTPTTTPAKTTTASLSLFTRVNTRGRQWPYCSTITCMRFCSHGLSVDGQGCARCSCRSSRDNSCPSIWCMRYCPYGLVVSANGCPICECFKAPTVAPATVSDEESCGRLVCMMYCPRGYVRDAKTGCRICQCIQGEGGQERRMPGQSGVTNPPNELCPSFLRCRIYCRNGLRVNDYGCPICSCAADSRSTECQALTCMVYCPAGYHKDLNGCPTCACKNASNDTLEAVGPSNDRSPAASRQCARIQCLVFCREGYFLDDMGCPICRCKNRLMATQKPDERIGKEIIRRVDPSAQPCRPLVCTLWCPFGYDLDVEGCPVCRCVDDPCDGVACRHGTHCESQLSCISGRCTYETRCKPPRCTALCSNMCLMGYETSWRGCPTCRCRQRPCYGALCGACWEGRKCEPGGGCMHKVTCFEHIFPPSGALGTTPRL